MEKRICLEKFSWIKFEDREFYIPLVSCEIEIYGKILIVTLWREEDYVIANGLKCYRRMQYNADTDTILTTLKEAIMDGYPISPNGFLLSFPYNALEFPYSEKDPRIVIPKRDYSELTNAFLAENPYLDDSIRHFLLEHPEAFNTYAHNPKIRQNMNKMWWLVIDRHIKSARKDPEFRKSLLEVKTDPSWLHEFYVNALGSEN